MAVFDHLILTLPLAGKSTITDMNQVPNQLIAQTAICNVIGVEYQFSLTISEGTDLKNTDTSRPTTLIGLSPANPNNSRGPQGANRDDLSPVSLSNYMLRGGSSIVDGKQTDMGTKDRGLLPTYGHYKYERVRNHVTTVKETPTAPKTTSTSYRGTKGQEPHRRIPPAVPVYKTLGHATTTYRTTPLVNLEGPSSSGTT